MQVVAIHGLNGDVAAHAAALAGVLGVTAYEARSRVQVPGGGPAVVGTRPAGPEVETLADSLRQAGFSVLVVDAAVASEVRAFEVRSFTLEAASLVVSTRAGLERRVPWDAIDALVRGTSAVRETSRHKVKERSLSVGRAVMTGGLIVHKTREKESVSTTTHTDSFLLVRATGAGVLRFTQSELAYQSLGEAMQPSRTANFTHLVSEIRRRAGRAIFDDRLQRRAVQQQILGPSLNADDHLDLAAALILRAT